MSTMTLKPAPEGRRFPATRVVLTAIAASTLPVLVGAILIVSMWLRRPLLALPQWGWAVPRASQAGDDGARRATISWSLVLFAAGVVQVAMEAGTGLSMSSPAGFLTRSLAALAVEATAFMYIRHRDARGSNPQPAGAFSNGPDVDQHESL